MRWLPGVITTVVLTAVTVGIMTEPKQNVRPADAWIVPDSTADGINAAFRLSPAWVRQPNGLVSAGILPHHALVSPIIAAWFTGLEQQSAPATVVIIGPDHHNAGAGYISTANNDWHTPRGVIETNQRIVRALVEAGDAVIDPALIRLEHGVYTAIPYIHQAWPKAMVVPLAIKGDLRSNRLARIAEHLDQLLEPDDLVIATVDFSHYQSASSALQEDEQSLSIIARGDAEGALQILVDSPPAISLILRYANRRGLKYQQLVHTTSSQFSGEPAAQSTTSYVNAYFVRQ